MARYYCGDINTREALLRHEDASDMLRARVTILCEAQQYAAIVACLRR